MRGISGRTFHLAERTKKWRESGKGIDAHIKSKFGVDEATYQRMLAEQGGGCAICGRPETVVDKRSGKPRRLAVDHCHRSGAVRGLLCHNCNVGIGLLDHDIARLIGAVAYLERSCAGD